MRTIASLATLAALAGGLTGCAGSRSFMAPLPPATLDNRVEARQQLTATYRGKTQSMQVALKAIPDDLTLVGLTDIGQRLFTLSWNGQNAELASSVDALDKLDPDRVLVDLQLAYWPLAVLRSHLDPDLVLEQHGSARLLWYKGELAWLAARDGADHWRSPLTIYNARAGYRLDIRPLSVDLGEPAQ